MAATEEPIRMSTVRAAAQGYLLIPSIATPIDLATGFSTDLAATPISNPFITQNSPFDAVGLGSATFVYRKGDNCRGTYLSVSTSTSSSSSEHLSLSLGVSVGNAVLGASVTGSYDRSVLEDNSLSKMSRKTSFQAGSIQFQRPPPLSTQAQQLLLPENGGFDAFVKRYGDFYVSGFSIGGEAAVLVSQAASRYQSKEKLKAQLEVQVLCFSDSTALAEKDINIETADVQLSLVAFDTLDKSFLNFSARNGNLLNFGQARRLAGEYVARVDNMSARIEQRVKSLGGVLDDSPVGLSWDLMHAIAQSDVISHLILLPYSTHREVREYLSV